MWQQQPCNKLEGTRRLRTARGRVSVHRVQPAGAPAFSTHVLVQMPLACDLGPLRFSTMLLV